MTFGSLLYCGTLPPSQPLLPEICLHSSLTCDEQKGDCVGRVQICQPQEFFERDKSRKKAGWLEDLPDEPILRLFSGTQYAEINDVPKYLAIFTGNQPEVPKSSTIAFGLRAAGTAFRFCV